MFKYKFEIWRYGLFRMKDAEGHLNEMASKGYELETVTETGFPRLAYYNKTPGTKKRYAVVALTKTEDKNDMEEYIEASGWEKVAHFLDGFAIFATAYPQARDIFTDDESRVESIMRASKRVLMLAVLVQ